MLSARTIRIIECRHVGGHCFVSELPEIGRTGDTLKYPYASDVLLLENEAVLGPPHAMHTAIAEEGGGRYSHWNSSLYFSTSDNSDPRSNEREYYIHAPLQPLASTKVERAVQALRALPITFTSAEAYLAVERCLAVLYPEAKIGEDSKLFWSDEEFVRTYRRLCGDNHRSLERKYAAHSLVKSVLRLSGDVVECGTYNGGTAYFLAKATREALLPRQVYLFDSFEGLSTPGRHDGSYWQAGSLSVDEQECRKNLEEFDNIHLLRGWIPDRFNELSNGHFCFVHVDVDLYQPTRDSLEFFYPRLQSGGILLCDDYGFVTCPGATLAMDEFFADKPEKIVHLPSGQGFVTKH